MMWWASIKLKLTQIIMIKPIYKIYNMSIGSVYNSCYRLTHIARAHLFAKHQLNFIMFAFEMNHFGYGLQSTEEYGCMRYTGVVYIRHGTFK